MNTQLLLLYLETRYRIDKFNNLVTDVSQRCECGDDKFVVALRAESFGQQRDETGYLRGQGKSGQKLQLADDSFEIGSLIDTLVVGFDKV